MYTIVLKNEDETIANLISKELLKNPNISFAAYKKTHPFDNDIIVEFETDLDGNKIFQDSIKKILTSIASIQSLIQ
jgi:DNA-directed RNA polymerase subunit L